MTSKDGIMHWIAEREDNAGCRNWQWLKISWDIRIRTDCITNISGKLFFNISTEYLALANWPEVRGRTDLSRWRNNLGRWRMGRWLNNSLAKQPQFVNQVGFNSLTLSVRHFRHVTFSKVMQFSTCIFKFLGLAFVIFLYTYLSLYYFVVAYTRL